MDNQATAAAIRNAIGAHGLWKARLRCAAQTGRLPDPVPTISDCDGGALGRLLAALEPELAGDADFEAVRRMHARLCAHVKRLTQLVAAGAGDLVTAELDRGGPFERRSRAFAARLSDWRLSLSYRGI